MMDILRIVAALYITGLIHPLGGMMWAKRRINCILVADLPGLRRLLQAGIFPS